MPEGAHAVLAAAIAREAPDLTPSEAQARATQQISEAIAGRDAAREQRRTQIVTRIKELMGEGLP